MKYIKPPENKRIFLIWRALVMLGFLLLVGINVSLARLGHRMLDTHPETYLTVAESWLEQDNFSQAFAAWEQAYDCDSSYARSFEVLGDIHFQMENWAPAVDSYQKSIHFGNPSEEMRTNLLVSLLNLQQYEAVIKQSRQFISGNAKNPFYYRYLAAALYYKQQFKDAIAPLQIALSKFPNDPFLLHALKKSYLAVGDERNAMLMDIRIQAVENLIDTYQVPLKP